MHIGSTTEVYSNLCFISVTPKLCIKLSWDVFLKKFSLLYSILKFLYHKTKVRYKSALTSSPVNVLHLIQESTSKSTCFNCLLRSNEIMTRRKLNLESKTYQHSLPIYLVNFSISLHHLRTKHQTFCS